MPRYCVIRITKKDKIKMTYLQDEYCDKFWTEDKEFAEASCAKMRNVFPDKFYQVIEQK